MNNLSNNFFYFISGTVIGCSFVYLWNLNKINLLNNEVNLLNNEVNLLNNEVNLLNNEVNLLNNKIISLEKKNLNLIEHLMYMDSSPYESYNFDVNY